MKRGLMLGISISFMASAAWAGPAAKTWNEAATGMPFVAVPKGCIQMGSAKPVQPIEDTHWSQFGRPLSISENEVPQHEVCVDAFWMGKYEVTVKEWQDVMEMAPTGTPNHPIAAVTWDEARDFAERLTARSGGKYRFRLPTEAEWEYACRAGKKVETGDKAEAEDLNKVAWYQYRQPKPTAVGGLAANAFGLHDMLGNVWEWVGDSYLADGYARHGLYNPRVETDAPQRVIRGGSVRTELEQTRCAKRGHYPAAETLDTVGFRLVREK